MDAVGNQVAPGDLRVSDADRDRAVSELSEHFQTGRLTQQEFEDRSGRALKARTGRELSELFTDLPHGLPPVPASPGTVRRAGRIPVGRVAIACVVAAIIAGNVLSTVHNFGHTHTVSLGWLVPILIIGFIFRRNVLGRR